LRNWEAARYARWAVIAAGVVVLAVAGVYVERAFLAARAWRAAPAAVPASVERESAQFTFSKVEQDRTLFTIRASHATQFRDQDRALLEDVWITIYGPDGSRNDNIHTRECSYEPLSGMARCKGEVNIDIETAKPAPGEPAAKTLELKTSNLSFNRNTGEASTPAPVEFRFPAGQGRGVGVAYSTHDSIVRVEHAVEFDLAASERTGGLPVTASGSSLEVHTKNRAIVLQGPAIVRQGNRELSADRISVELDENNRARRAVAEGHPQIRAAEGGGRIAISAARFEALLNPAGWVERVIADGGFAGMRQTAAGSDHFSAARAEFAMVPQSNLLKEMTASGGVRAESQRGGAVQMLKTDALRVTFSTGGRPGEPAGQRAVKTADRRQAESVETLAPATIESKSGDDTTTLEAKKFVALLGPGGRLDKLFGHSGVEVRRQIAGAAPQVLSAAEMAATFGASGEWDTVDESGNVRFEQADRRASAAHARIVRATDTITLDGSPVISDSMSRTTAAGVVINQKSGELRATGGVVSTYLPAAHGDAVGLGSGPAHIFADTLSGSVTSGHVLYAGHARLWQGESALDADQIELWRDDKRMQAAGHVMAVFPQVSGPFAVPFGRSSRPDQSRPTAPTLWKVRAPVLTYWVDQARAQLEGGVVASSSQGSLESRTLDVYLGPAAPAAGAAPSTSLHAPHPASGAAADRQLSRVLAEGNVIVQQGSRRGMADQAEYTAADGKFVLSGGQPTVTDNSSNTATGHSLTFFVANGTILVDSQEGSRTLTKHRIEK
jgi:lipopolysaccharide export system protein LptA